MMNIKKVFFLSIIMTILIGCGNTNSKTEDTTAPTFTTTNKVNIKEGLTTIITVQANDENNVSYTILDGADSDKFNIDLHLGVLSFKTSTDFENPTDSNSDGNYHVRIEAKDLKENSSTLNMIITVIDDETDNGPTFTSAEYYEIQENRSLDFTISAVTDNGSVIYNLEGIDQNRFELNSSSGDLSFLNFTPDFENPSDSDKNSVYKITIKAKDDNNNSSSQNLTITITDDLNDAVYTRKVYKTGVDDGVVLGSPFGDDRNFTTNANGTVTAGERVWEDSNHVGTNINFFDAKNYCDGLQYAGKSDWRLPNRHELFEITDYGKSGTVEQPTIDDAFVYKNNGIFWTSQELIGSDNTRAFAVRFFDALTINSTKSDNTLRVRCISGPKIEDNYNFTLSEDGKTIIDNSTGLVWENGITNLPLSWSDAKKRCETLVLDNKNDWRLPNVNEIRTNLPNYNNEILFENLSNISYDTGHSWSSTLADETHARYYENYWDQVNNRDILSVMYEEYTIDNAINNFFNRCIRGGHL